MWMLIVATLFSTSNPSLAIDHFQTYEQCAAAREIVVSETRDLAPHGVKARCVSLKSIEEPDKVVAPVKSNIGTDVSIVMKRDQARLNREQRRIAIAMAEMVKDDQTQAISIESEYYTVNAMERQHALTRALKVRDILIRAGMRKNRVSIRIVHRTRFVDTYELRLRTVNLLK